MERLEQEKDKLERERQWLLEKMKEHQEEMSVTSGSQEVKQDEVDNSRVTMETCLIWACIGPPPFQLCMPLPLLLRPLPLLPSSQ